MTESAGQICPIFPSFSTPKNAKPLETFQKIIVSVRSPTKLNGILSSIKILYENVFPCGLGSWRGNNGYPLLKRNFLEKMTVYYQKSIRLKF